jgi:hypothetical protein
MSWFGIGSDSKYDRSESSRSYNQLDYTAEAIYKIAEGDFKNNIIRDWINFTFKKQKDCDLYNAYLRQLRVQKENDELRRVVHDKNGEFYGEFQKNFEEVKKELETTELHLQLEKEAYQKLYMEKRELEAKLYAAGRELELRDYLMKKDLTNSTNRKEEVIKE